MNKSTKIWLNYLIGGALSMLLLWNIYLQIKKQLKDIGPHLLFHAGPSLYLVLGICLMPVNVLLEARKWHILANSVQPVSFGRSLASYIAGIAFSIITPNRLGEYPGRLLYLQQKNTFRLINVSILGSIAQLLALFIFGMLGLVYYNIAFPGTWEKVTLVATIAITVAVMFMYWQFEGWLPLLQKVRWLRRFSIYGQLLKRVSVGEQWDVLGLSLIRFGVFTAQYLFLLRWAGVHMPWLGGYCMAALFFWTMAVIPTIALAELGERGQVSLYLFHHFSPDTVGILSATIGVWCLNLIIPAIAGSILIIRMRILR